VSALLYILEVATLPFKAYDGDEIRKELLLALGLMVLVVAVPISTPFKYNLIAVVSKTPTT
jgi:type III secretory pathway component EscR